MDTTTVLEKYTQDLSNLPLEVRHLLEEIKNKDLQLSDIRRQYQFKDNQLHKFIRANGTLTKHPKEQQLYLKIEEEMNAAIKLQKEKILLSNTALFLISKHLFNFETDITKLERDELLPPLESPVELETKEEFSGLNGFSDSLSATPTPSSMTPVAEPVKRGQKRKAPVKGASVTPSAPVKVNKHKSEEVEDSMPLTTGSLAINGSAEMPTSEGPLGEDADNNLYCFCQRVSFGEMIACDNGDCKTIATRRFAADPVAPNATPAVAAPAAGAAPANTPAAVAAADTPAAVAAANTPAAGAAADTPAAGAAADTPAAGAAANTPAAGAAANTPAAGAAANTPAAGAAANTPAAGAATTTPAAGAATTTPAAGAATNTPAAGATGTATTTPATRAATTTPATGAATTIPATGVAGATTNTTPGVAGTGVTTNTTPGVAAPATTQTPGTGIGASSNVSRKSTTTNNINPATDLRDGFKASQSPSENIVNTLRSIKTLQLKYPIHEQLESNSSLCKQSTSLIDEMFEKTTFTRELLKQVLLINLPTALNLRLLNLYYELNPGTSTYISKELALIPLRNAIFDADFQGAIKVTDITMGHPNYIGHKAHILKSGALKLISTAAAITIFTKFGVTSLVDAGILPSGWEHLGAINSILLTYIINSSFFVTIVKFGRQLVSSGGDYLTWQKGTFYTHWFKHSDEMLFLSKIVEADRNLNNGESSPEIVEEICRVAPDTRSNSHILKPGFDRDGNKIRLMQMKDDLEKVKFQAYWMTGGDGFEWIEPDQDPADIQWREHLKSYNTPALNCKSAETGEYKWADELI
ncbi:hypothetical protein KGF56_003698 [Candida oxycetoniae]|uniref:Inhibitor of growth protein N-terminal histone-binding domain-containing protein n=1 Tax=Candida oxycetoniae TaxID=497107 RepID=A0AAI9SVB0_9ASCO|nr:uncharacterized protein KGF56_003698 [Candida oxycetoniae]KAI3403541.2 hypothetical protein KGF56_003698 [Candida oxycetoniae]